MGDLEPKNGLPTFTLTQIGEVVFTGYTEEDLIKTKTTPLLDAFTEVADSLEEYYERTGH